MKKLEDTQIITAGSMIIEHDPKKGIIQKVKVFPPTFNKEIKTIENSAVVDDYLSSPEIKVTITYNQGDN